MKNVEKFKELLSKFSTMKSYPQGFKVADIIKTEEELVRMYN